MVAYTGMSSSGPQASGSNPRNTEGWSLRPHEYFLADVSSGCLGFEDPWPYMAMSGRSSQKRENRSPQKITSPRS